MQMSLNGVWRFFPDLANEGDSFRFWEISYEDRLWRETIVPGCFEHGCPGLDGYLGSAWYRRSFHVPEEWSDRRVRLCFGSVHDRARIWLNGVFLGDHEDPFLPFSFDVTECINRTGPNILTVEADNRARDEDVPGMHVGWRRFGGILRDVGIEAFSPLHVGMVHVSADPNTGSVRVEAMFRQAGGIREQGTAKATVMDAEGRPALAFDPVPVGPDPGENITVQWQGTVPNARMWSPENPVLYRLHVTVETSDGRSDEMEKRFGFRRLTAVPDGLMLNGRRVFLTGFNRHEDSVEAAMAFDAATTRRDLEQMKEGGCNFVRLCHYPHDPKELDLCDELGLMVMAEVPLYFWNDMEAGRRAQKEREKRGSRQLDAMIERDRHHACIVMWSVSNETNEDEPELAAMNRRLVRQAKLRDPDRICLHVSNRWPTHPNFAEDDLIAINGYPSLRWTARGKGPDYDGTGAATEWRESIEKLHALYPEKPILVSEFGYRSFESVHDGGFGEERHARQLEIEFGAFDAPYVCGALIWCWADHAWPPFPRSSTGFLSISSYGVVTRDRRTKLPFFAARKMFRARQGMTEKTLDAISPTRLIMIRNHLRDIPEAAFPPGYGMRTMTREDVGLWTDIQRDAEPFIKITDDLFVREFGDDWEGVKRRCFLILDEKGLGVGTISAWRNVDFQGRDYGRIHWVAIRPAHQRKGLAKAALTAALKQLAQWHDCAYLVTSTERIGAIRLYLDYGFEAASDSTTS
jgi:beta-glucuronidase